MTINRITPESTESVPETLSLSERRSAALALLAEIETEQSERDALAAAALAAETETEQRAALAAAIIAGDVPAVTLAAALTRVAPSVAQSVPAPPVPEQTERPTGGGRGSGPRQQYNRTPTAEFSGGRWVVAAHSRVGAVEVRYHRGRGWTFSPLTGLSIGEKWGSRGATPAARAALGFTPETVNLPGHSVDGWVAIRRNVGTPEKPIWQTLTDVTEMTVRESVRSII